jgi:hypothetical protein
LGQLSAFQQDCLAPDEWVRTLEGARIGHASWRDGSWGNNAAPSWELAHGDVVLAEAFYYSPENGERYTEHFDGRPYVSVVLFDEDENPTVAFESSPEDFLSIVRSASGRPEVPEAAFLKAAEDAPTPQIYWNRDI